MRELLRNGAGELAVDLVMLGVGLFVAWLLAGLSVRLIAALHDRSLAGEPATERLAVVTRPFTASGDPEWAEGTVRSAGTLWRARCRPADAARITVGDRVRVVDHDRMVLRVEPRRATSIVTTASV